jgi:hypothetical protein
MKEKVTKHQTLETDKVKRLEPVKVTYTVKTTTDTDMTVTRRYDSKIIKMRSYNPTTSTLNTTTSMTSTSTTSGYHWILVLDHFLQVGWSPEGIVYYFGQEMYNQLFKLDKSISTIQSKIDLRVNDLLDDRNLVFPAFKFDSSSSAKSEADQILDYAKLNQEFLKDREKKKLDYLKVDSILIKWQSEIDSKKKD